MKRFDIFWGNLDPVQGSEISKRRPVVIISPDELNAIIRTVMVLPVTTKFRAHYPFRVASKINGRAGQIALDQIRAVDKSRLGQKMAELDAATAEEVLDKLRSFFAA